VPIRSDEARSYYAPNVDAALALMKTLRDPVASADTAETSVAASVVRTDVTDSSFALIGVPKPAGRQGREHVGAVAERPDRAAVNTAAAILLRADHRNRKVVLEELLRECGLGASDATRCVRLAAAKLAYEYLYPETAHGKNKATRDPESGSLPFWKYAMMKVGGWKRATISRWCAVGEALSHGAYETLLGTSLANDLGRLDTLSRLPECEQISVATKFSLKLEREGKQQLERLSAAQLTASTEADSDEPPTVAVSGPPADAKVVEVARSRSGVVCILNDHIIEVTDLGDHTRLLDLGVASPRSRPERVATEDWIDAVTTVIAKFRQENPDFVVETTPIAWVPPTGRTKQHHMMSVAATTPDARRLVLQVRRWECLDHAGKGSSPMYLSGRGNVASYVWVRPKEPIVTIGEDWRPRAQWVEGNFDDGVRIAYALTESLNRLTRAGVFQLRRKARTWFTRQRASAPLAAAV
jgi:hypothetical protein